MPRLIRRAAARKRATGPVRYVDSSAAGGGNGQSWATAWNSIAAVQWSQLTPGATLYISGGTSSKTYTAGSSGTVGIDITNSVVGSGNVVGTAGNPITIRRGVDAGHTGEPVFDGQSAWEWGLRIESRAYINAIGLAFVNCKFGGYRIRFNTRDVILDGCRAFCPDFTGSPRGFDIRSNVTSGAAGTWAAIMRRCSTDTVANTVGQTDTIFTLGNDGLLMEDNTIVCSNGNTTGHSDGWQSFQGINVTFRNNIVSHPNGGNDNHGLWLEDTVTGGTLMVYNNVVARGATNSTFGISHNRQVAAGTGYDGRALIYNNTSYNGDPGLHIWNAPLTEAKNNIVCFLPGGEGVRLQGTLPATTAVNNNLVYSTSGTVAEVSGTNRTWSQYQGLGFDVNGVNANPLFANAASGDFTLQAGSPALNAGATIAAVTSDKNGVARPQGASHDIGAYERV